MGSADALHSLSGVPSMHVRVYYYLLLGVFLPFCFHLAFVLVSRFLGCPSIQDYPLPQKNNGWGAGIVGVGDRWAWRPWDPDPRNPALTLGVHKRLVLKLDQPSWLSDPHPSPHLPRAG